MKQKNKILLLHHMILSCFTTSYPKLQQQHLKTNGNNLSWKVFHSIALWRRPIRYRDSWKLAWNRSHTYHLFFKTNLAIKKDVFIIVWIKACGIISIQNLLDFLSLFLCLQLRLVSKFNQQDLILFLFLLLWLVNKLHLDTTCFY